MNKKQELVMYTKIYKFMKKYKLGFYYGIRNLLWDLDIKLITYEGMDFISFMAISEDAFSVYEKGNRYIFYNPFQPERRKNFTLAHELGHFLFEHHQKAGGDVLAFGDHGLMERQANIFARNLLMPPKRTLEYLDVKTPRELADIFEVSYQMANIRLQTLDYDNKWLNFVKAKKF